MTKEEKEVFEELHGYIPQSDCSITHEDAVNPEFRQRILAKQCGLEYESEPKWYEFWKI